MIPRMLPMPTVLSTPMAPFINALGNYLALLGERSKSKAIVAGRS
jgi:hypothetical protein